VKNGGAICVWIGGDKRVGDAADGHPKTGRAHPTPRMMLDDVLTDRLSGDWTIRNRIRKGRTFKFLVQLAGDVDLSVPKSLFVLRLSRLQ